MPKNDDMIRENEDNGRKDFSEQNVEENTVEAASDNSIENAADGADGKKDIFARSEDALENLSFGTEDVAFLDNLSAEDPALGFDVIDGQSQNAEEKTEEDPPKKVKFKKKVINERGTSVRSLAFAAIYVVGVLVLAIILAQYIITRANDAFAFVKDDIEVTVEIKDDKMTLDALAELLHEAGAIKYPGFFKFYVNLKNDGKFTLKEGTYKFSAANNYDVILSKVNPVPPRETVTITIPEGFTTDDIIDLCVAKGIGTREGFVDAINNAELDYWFLEPLKEGTHEERFYRLDGYLYPDTYYFYTTSSEVSVLKKILNNFNKKFAKAYETRCQELGITIDEAIILASIIQAEAKYAADYQYVSSVLYNRINNTREFTRLDCDATLQYYFRHTEGARHPELTASDLKVDSAYNTRITGDSFYTPGPICSPSLTAIKAALYPADTQFYFFICKPNGYNVYSKTYSQHMKYVAMTPEQLNKVEQELY